MWGKFRYREIWAQPCQLNRWYECHEIFFETIYAILLQNMFCCNLRCSAAKLFFSPFTQFLCGDKFSPKFCPWRKNNKYCVCWVTNRGKAKQDISWSGVERIESIFHQLCWPASKSLLASNCPKLSYFAIFDKIYIFDANYFPFPISLLLIYKV